MARPKASAEAKTKTPKEPSDTTTVEVACNDIVAVTVTINGGDKAWRTGIAVSLGVAAAHSISTDPVQAVTFWHGNGKTAFGVEERKRKAADGSTHKAVKL